MLIPTKLTNTQSQDFGQGTNFYRDPFKAISIASLADGGEAHIPKLVPILFHIPCRLRHLINTFLYFLHFPKDCCSTVKPKGHIDVPRSQKIMALVLKDLPQLQTGAAPCPRSIGKTKLAEVSQGYHACNTPPICLLRCRLEGRMARW